jgi:cell division protein FtsW
MNIKKELKKVDLHLLIATILLLIIGIVAVTSASFPTAKKYDYNSFHYAIRQAVFLVMGIIALIFILKVPRNVLYKNIDWIFVLSLMLIGLLWTPAGVKVYGQARWLRIPGVGILFQPSDILKVTSIVFFAKYLSKNINKLKDPVVFIKILAILGISVVPVMIKDFSTAVVIGISLFAMLVCAGLNKKQFGVLVLLGAILVAIMLTNEDYYYRIKRILGFVSDSTDYLSADLYQARQSLYAFALGGYTGVGLFRSRQKYTNLPQAYTDFIYSVIAEEFGLIGCMLVLILFVVYIYRGYIIAVKTTNYFDKLTAVGITTFIGIQAFFNMGVAAKLLPVTGITLPFISYGGSALIMAIASTAILLKISAGGKN